MKIPFTKYQGTGNDFIMIDNRSRIYDHVDVEALCRPRFGIGADGLMLLQNAEGFDFDMVYYNSDGRISTMCGNGGRCLVDFAKRLQVFEGHQTLFRAADGPHHAHWSENRVELQMKDVDLIEHRDPLHYVLDTGSPHMVCFVEDSQAVDIVSEARAIRYNDEFSAKGINVNFVQVVSANEIYVRTYERGVENETLSCGTGVTASAIALSAHLGLHGGERTIDIHTLGGRLQVSYQSEQGKASRVWLCGPATRVFEGQIEL